jgi:hypothetical protein
MNRGVALGRGLLVTLATPSTWPLALAAFLIRGGIILLVIPIVVVPTPVGLGNVFGPTLTALALGQVPLEAVVGAGLAGLTVVAWLFGGGWLAAALEAEGARIVAADAGAAGGRPLAADGRPAVDRPGRAGGTVASRILAARLAAAVPLVLVLAWASFRLVLTTYNELTAPRDVTTPIVLRVLAATPEVVVAIVLAWMAGEIVGAIAARRIALHGDGVGRALLAAVGECLRHPLSVLVRFWIPTVVLGLVVVASAAASAAAWSATGDALADGGDPVRILVSVMALVAVFAVGLILLGVTCAWRAAIWTIAEAVREGTFGGSTDRRSGDWRTEGSSATL